MARISDERPKQALKPDVLVVGGGAAGLAAAYYGRQGGRARTATGKVRLLRWSREVSGWRQLTPWVTYRPMRG
jgi:succinate dehydrogenase/fumarate reductase flavoprotein subunit